MPSSISGTRRTTARPWRRTCGGMPRPSPGRRGGRSARRPRRGFGVAPRDPPRPLLSTKPTLTQPDDASPKPPEEPPEADDGAQVELPGPQGFRLIAAVVLARLRPLWPWFVLAAVTL